MKKGELSMSVIIGAVIAIVILVIIVYLVITNSGNTRDATACPGKGGSCVEQFKCEKVIVGENMQQITCPNVGEVCCALNSINN